MWLEWLRSFENLTFYQFFFVSDEFAATERRFIAGLAATSIQWRFGGKLVPC